MTDLNHYRNQVGDLTKKAKAHEDKEEYEQAYQTYISALDIFTHLLKFEKNNQLKDLYK
jgi:Zn/Cd-binding protein ZinT